jgi:cyclopropane-fatty-acyl-phospholipid synthase
MKRRRGKWKIPFVRLVSLLILISSPRRFIEQYIFPGGYLPSTLQLLNHISRQSKGGLTLESVENIGGHHVKALRLWRESFLCNFEDKIKPALLNDHPTMSKLDIEVFRRKWEVSVITATTHP